MKEIVNTINKISKGYEVYAVGGFTRDLILKAKYKDIDLVVNKDAHKFAEKVTKSLNAKMFVLDDIDKIYRIVIKDSDIANIDISLIDGETIEEDLKNRDFTVNAAAFELKYFNEYKKHIVYGVKDCEKDLKSKSLNTVSPDAFKKDPLRMLRAFRFMAELGLKITDKTLKQIKKDAKLINKAAPERIKNEFFIMLSSKNASKTISLMDKSGLLESIFPEIKDMKKASKKYYYHPGGLFQHSFETMEAAENILNNLKKFFPDNYKELEEHFNEKGIYSENVSRSSLLKFVALFHDMAKPETAKKEGNKIRFFGHEDAGAEKICKIMNRLKMGKKDIANAKLLVQNHMRPSTLTKNNIVTKKAALKFFRDIADNTPDLFLLSMADWHSYKRLKVFAPKELKMQEKSLRKLISFYFEVKNFKPLPKIINGNIIMRKFKLKPGPWIGELMEIVIEAQEAEEIKDEKEAIKLISENLNSVKKKYNL